MYSQSRVQCFATVDIHFNDRLSNEESVGYILLLIRNSMDCIYSRNIVARTNVLTIAKLITLFHYLYIDLIQYLIPCTMSLV